MNDLTPKPPSAARLRILNKATELFYAEGVRSVGIDRIIAEAEVAKATFYKYFPSKDDLVRAYIEEQDRIGRASLGALAGGPSPIRSLSALFDTISEAAVHPGYRGCPFLNAAAEYPDPDSPVRKAIDDHRRWHRELLRTLLVVARHPDPDNTADVLVALWDGLLVSGHVDDPGRIQFLTRHALAGMLKAVSTN
jgi:AcrR family transcriptional regulator